MIRINDLTLDPGQVLNLNHSTGDRLLVVKSGLISNGEVVITPGESVILAVGETVELKSTVSSVVAIGAEK